MVFSRLSLSLVPRNVMRNSLRRSHGHEETYKGQVIITSLTKHLINYEINCDFVLNRICLSMYQIIALWP
jgi:hypothetical protein